MYRAFPIGDEPRAAGDGYIYVKTNTLVGLLPYIEQSNLMNAPDVTQDWYDAAADTNIEQIVLPVCVGCNPLLRKENCLISLIMRTC